MEDGVRHGRNERRVSLGFTQAVALMRQPMDPAIIGHIDGVFSHDMVAFRQRKSIRPIPGRVAVASAISTKGVARHREETAMHWRETLQTRAPGWTILIRLLVGLAVFFPEGIQKLIFPDILGAGRFERIGIPLPDLMGPFVGVVEILCGALIIVGLLTRLAAVPLIIIMIVAIVSTKIPILLGQDFWIFHLPKFNQYGFWSMSHEGRADFTMLLASLYLLIEGAGQWSLDALLAERKAPAQLGAQS
jgi:putative oxidoreductase